jgi:hypothetical protein
MLRSVTRARQWLLGILVGLPGVAAFASSLGAGFTYDDYQSILGHSGVHGPFSLRNIFLLDFWGYPFSRTVGTYRPITTLTFFCDWHLSGGEPWSFHATNLVLYAVLLLTADRVLRRWCGSAISEGARLLAVAVFGLLAVHADVVPSATGRAEILAALFVLTSLWLLLGDRVGLGALSLLAAILCKESALPMALAVPLIVLSGRRAEWRRLLPMAAACVAVLGAYVAFRAGRLPFSRPTLLTANVMHGYPLLRQKAGACEVVTHYLEHVVTGLDLAPDYSYSGIALTLRATSPRAMLGAGFFAALIGLGLRTYRARPRVAEAVVGLFGSYLVASHLIVPASAMIADRLFFLPSFWLVALAALGLDAIRGGWRRVAAIAAGSFAVAQGLLAAAVATHWHDDAVLHAQALQLYPHVARTRSNFSYVLSQAGMHDEAAWHGLLAAAYYTRFPRPIGKDEFPLAWDDLPMEQRLDALGGALGDRRMQTLLRQTAESLRPHQRGASRVLAGWAAQRETR